MDFFTIDNLPDPTLLKEDSSHHEEAELKDKNVEEDREAEALENFLLGSSKRSKLSPDLDGQSKQKRKKAKKAKKAAWEDDDDLILAKDGFANARKYPKKVTKETVYRSHLVDKFEAIYGKPKWVDKTLERSKQDSDEDLLGTAGDIFGKSSRLPKSNLEYSRCALLTLNEDLNGIITSVQFHPTSNIALIAGIHGQINITQVDGDENRYLNSIFLQNFQLHRARFSADGKEIIIGSKSSLGHFFSYDVMSGKHRRVPLIRGKDRLPLRDFVLSTDGEYLASCGRKGNFYLTNMMSKEIVESFKLNEEVNSLCFSPDSKKLFASGEEGDVYVFDIRQSRRCLHRFVDEGALDIRYSAVSPNTSYFVTGDQSGYINVYKYEDIFASQNPVPLKSFTNLNSPISCLKFNHTSEMLFACSSYADDSVRMAHFPSCTIFSNFPQPNSSYKRINEVDISPNSGYLTMANNKGRVYLYRLNHYADY